MKTAKTAGIIYNARIPEALDLSTAIFDGLALGGRSWVSSAEDMDKLVPRMADTDLVITVGGDGTILRAIRVTAPCEVPVVGINMGRLGFMTELSVQEALEKLPLYFNGACRVEERGMLQARLVNASAGGSARVDGPYHAVNDVVLARGAASRVVTIRATIDGAELTTFRADGVILATATGSTGYNLSVGGPILDPLSDCLVLKPVAAHVGLAAGLVLQSGSKVQLSLGGDQQAILSVDGHVDYPMSPGDRVEVEQSPLKARFLRANPPNDFYATLTRRLGFGVSRRGQ
ncbi:MAG: NAD(+)/NADH kinase [Dehalococcoidia bacterium]|nr:NAD(+)/NADH kinase [Dehalococcoidia bacterium]MSQ16619.1 NAD(+)/NADH kinase [Dehalococcoidia bacterium]